MTGNHESICVTNSSAQIVERWCDDVGNLKVNVWLMQRMCGKFSMRSRAESCAAHVTIVAQLRSAQNLHCTVRVAKFIRTRRQVSN